jgi:hypothetical protein
MEDLALVKWGENGCLCGDNMLVIQDSECFIDVSELGGHHTNQLHIFTATDVQSLVRQY